MMLIEEATLFTLGFIFGSCYKADDFISNVLFVLLPIL